MVCTQVLSACCDCCNRDLRHLGHKRQCAVRAGAVPIARAKAPTRPGGGGGRGSTIPHDLVGQVVGHRVEAIGRDPSCSESVVEGNPELVEMPQPLTGGGGGREVGDTTEPSTNSAARCRVSAAWCCSFWSEMPSGLTRYCVPTYGVPQNRPAPSIRSQRSSLHGIPLAPIPADREAADRRNITDEWRRLSLYAPMASPPCVSGGVATRSTSPDGSTRV